MNEQVLFVAPPLVWFATQVDPNAIVEIKDQNNQTVFRITAKVLLS